MRKINDPCLFGTDGIRSKYGDFPLDSVSVTKIGRAVSAVFGPSRILVGRDTRESGEEIEKRIASGIGEDSEIFSAGVIPTPALSYNVRTGPFDLGIMITASHNPWADNGIKFFGSDGEKISDEDQAMISRIFFEGSFRENDRRSSGDLIPYNGSKVYVRFLCSAFPEAGSEFSGILLDCANGAVSTVAPEVFSGLGFGFNAYNARPDGRNINEGCGSTVPEFLRDKIIAGEGVSGVAFDGDGDRVLLLDGSGRVLDGDFLLFIIARYLKETDPEFNPVVVGTVMSNLRLEKELAGMGIRLLRSDVGDRHVYDRMKEESAVLGGEQSGHVIYRKLQRTGDGILTALLFYRALHHLGITAGEASGMFAPYPQVTRNIAIREKRDIGSWDQLNRMIANFHEKHGGNSRLLVRYSGTEKKIRLMIESEDGSVIKNNIGIFENFLISEIGERT